MRNKKGFVVHPLAMALLVVLLIILIASMVPQVKATIIEILSATR